MATENHCDDPMGLQQQQEEEEEEEEGQFDRMVREIGGRENIYLVGETDGEGNGSIFQELILEMFQTNVIITGHKHPANGDFKSGACRPPAQSCPGSHDPHTEGRNADVEQQTAGHKVRTVRQRANTGQKIRAIHCPVIIFIFRHEFLQNKANRGCMEKILKDVKARVKKARGAHQALLGLIRADAESLETRESVVLLQEKLRSVFTKRLDDSIWAGHFIPKAADGMEDIKRNACRAVQASLSTGQTEFLSPQTSLLKVISRAEGALFSGRCVAGIEEGAENKTKEARTLRYRKMIQRRKEFHYRPDPPVCPDAAITNSKTRGIADRRRELDLLKKRIL